MSDFERGPLLFDVETPLGFRVHCTEEYWKRKVLADHNDMVGMVEDVIQALAEPDEVRVSSSDPEVLLFYVMGTKRFVCAVARDAESGGFLYYSLYDQLDEAGNHDMDKIKVRFDPTDNTLQVFFGDPATMAYLSPVDDETPEDVFLIRDENDRVIGFEGHFYHLEPGSLPVELETLPLLSPDGRMKPR